MADEKNTPFAVRMDQDEKERLLALIQESGKNNKEFMSSLLNAYELNKTKVEIPELAQDITALQALTQQINDYYVNIGKRIETMQKLKDLEFTKEMEVYKNRIDTLKVENDKLRIDFSAVQQAYNSISTDHEDVVKQLNQCFESLKDKNLIVEEYKNKNDTLTGLLNEYKQYKTEIEEYKKLLSESQTEKFTLQNSLKEKVVDVDNLNNILEDLKTSKENAISELDAKHKLEIQSLKDKLELDKDKTMLQLDKDYQEQLQQIQKNNNKEISEYQEKLQQLQDKSNKEIVDYQNKYKGLLEELDKIKNLRTKSIGKQV